MRAAFYPVAVLVAAAASPAVADETTDATVSALAERWYAQRLVDSGQVEEADGSTSMGGSFWSATPESFRRRAQFSAEILEELEKVDRSGLSQSGKIDAAVLRHLLKTEIGDAKFREWEMPFDSDNNFWSYLASSRGFATVEEYDRYITRMRDIPRYFAENKANARAGLKRGFSVPRVTLEGRDASLAAYVVDDPEKSPFWGGFAQMPERFPDAEKERLLAAGRAAISESVTPAYRDFLDFFRNEYLPKTRTTLGASEFPNGKA